MQQKQRKKYKQQAVRKLTPEQQQRLQVLVQQHPMYRHMVTEGWVWMSGAEAVAAGLVDSAHLRTWPGRKNTFPEGMAWANVGHPSGTNKAWAWGFSPWFLEQIARGLA